MRALHPLTSAFLLLIAGAVSADVRLAAIDGLSAQHGDRSGVTSAPLENGVDGNLFGGIGSGLAHVAGDRFLALPDRGPNAGAYNPGVNDTATYIPRFHTLQLDLRAAPAGDPLPLQLTPRLITTTLLHTHIPLVYGNGVAQGLPDGTPALNRTRRNHYFTGRADAFDPKAPSTSPGDGRLDPEGIRVSPDGRSVDISDEYGPFVYRFSRISGQRTRAYALPPEYAAVYKSAVCDNEISGNTAGRVANKGMEGLSAPSPNRSTPPSARLSRSTTTSCWSMSAMARVWATAA